MRLTSIQARGLKGGDGAPVELAPVTVIVGPNAAGKTRVLDAALLAALGYHPDWPRTADGVLAAADGDEIDVLATFGADPGGEAVTIRRTWERSTVKSGKAAGTVRTSADVECSTYAGRDKAGRERAARDLFGLPAGKEAREDAETALDVRRFLALSDDRRRGLIFRLSAEAVAAEWTAPRIREALPAEHHDVLDEWGKDEDAAAFLSRVAARASEDVLRLAGELRDARAAMDELGEVDAVEPEYVGGLRDAEAAAHAAASKGAEDGRARIDAALARVEEAEAAARKIDRIQAEIVGAEQELARLRSAAGPDAGEAGKLRVALADLDDGFADDGLPALAEAALSARAEVERAAQGDGVAALDRAVAEAEAQSRGPAEPEAARLQAAKDAAAAALDAAKATLRAADGEHARVVGALSSAREGARRLDEVVARLDAPDPDAFGDPVCPTCMQEVGARALATLRGTAELAHGYARDQETVVGAARAAQQRAVDGVQAAADALSDAERREVDAQRAAGAAWQARVDEARRLRAEAAQRAGARRAEIAERARAADGALRAAQGRKDNLLRALRAVESAGPDAGRIGELEGRIEALRGSLPDVPDLADVRAAYAKTGQLVAEERDRADASVRAAAAARQEAEERLHRRQHYLDVRAKAESLDELLATAKARAAALGPRGLLGAVLRSVLDPFVVAVRSVMDGLDLGEFAVRLSDERDAEVFRPGLERGASFSPLETLSQSERTVVCAGLSVALSRLAGLAWRPVLVDEIQSLDGPRWGDRRRKFLHRLALLVADGQIDQVIAVGCPDALSGDDLDDDQTVVIELPAAVAVAAKEAA